MNHQEKLKLFRTVLIDDIRKLLSNIDSDNIEFHNPFTCMIEEEDLNNGDYVKYPAIAKRIDSMGVIRGEDYNCSYGEWNYTELSLEEMAYLADVLSQTKFSLYDESLQTDDNE